MRPDKYPIDFNKMITHPRELRFTQQPTIKPKRKKKSRLKQILIFLVFVVYSVFFIQLFISSIYIYVVTQLIEAIYVGIFLFIFYLIVSYCFLSYSIRSFVVGLCMFVVLIFLMVPVVSSSRYVNIHPRTDPEIVFWCNPNDVDDIDGRFSVCIAVSYSSFFSNSIEDKISEALGKQKVYLAIGFSDHFYLTIDNAYSAPDVYEDLRQWLGTKLFHKNMMGIVVDAETPVRYINELHSNPNYVNYLVVNYPTVDEISIAERCLIEFSDMIHEDNLDLYMVRMHECTNDDIMLYTRNIYSLKFERDRTITMTYRTAYEIETEKFMNDLFGCERNGIDRVTYSDYWFYSRVKASDCVFIGVFGSEFVNTKYVNEKLYLKDIDICRSLRKDKIFIYDYDGFVLNYTPDELNMLYDYLSNENSIYITQYGYEAYSLISYYMFCNFIAFWDLK